VSAVYLSSIAKERIAWAQAVVDDHPAGVDGVCLRCGSSASCARPQALRTLTRYGRLPRRRPGNSRGFLAGPADGGFDWFPSGVTR